MGTRADFYLGRDPATMKWLGSTAFDGHPYHKRMKPICFLKSQTEYVAFVQGQEEFGDFTKPEQGWPWPWNNSKLTDFPYTFDDGQVWVANEMAYEPLVPEFWIPGVLAAEQDWPDENGPRDWSPRGNSYMEARFPDMTKIKKVAFGDRSGMIRMRRS